MATRQSWSFHAAGQLTFGPGAIARIGDLAGRHGWRRVLLITDENLVGMGTADRVITPLARSGVEARIFSGGMAEPSIEVAEKAIDEARSWNPDAILGLGGGSNMDLAKITATVYSHGGHPRDYFGFDLVPGPVVPLICVPTTAGTGSEVSHAAVLTDRANAIKVSTLSNWLRPSLAIVDPELSYSCPPDVAAASGIDALTHAIEACTATEYDKLLVPTGESSAYEGYFALGGCIAEEAIRLVGVHLTDAVRDPGNRAARDGMALAATLAGIAFSNCGVALVHALEYPMGGTLHCSHGAGNGLLLPYVMRFNLPARRASFARIAQLLGVDTETMSETEAAEAAIGAVEQLRRDIGIPERIRELGGAREQLPEFADKAYAIERLRWINPRPATRDQLLGILSAAF